MLYGARRAVMRHIKWMHFGSYFVLVIFPLLMIGMELAYGGTVGGAVRSNLAFYAGVALLWLLGIPLIIRWSSARTLRTTPSFQGELEYSITEAGVQIRSSVSLAQLAWATFVKATESKDFFLLFHNRNVASFMPKSAFESAAEQQDFRSLVSSQLGDRATWMAGARR
jgi:hypothetical protein